jgi:predicted small lipoprotein YifL
MIKKVSSLLIAATLSLAILGCGKKQPEENPQAVINKAIVKAFDKKDEIKKSEFKIDADINVSSNSDNATLSLQAKGMFDTTNVEDPIGEVNIDAKGKGNIKEQSADINLSLSLKALNQKLYTQLKKAEIDTGDPQINLVTGVIAGMYKDKWIYFPLSAEQLNQIKDSANFSESDAEGEKLLEILKQNQFITHQDTIGKRLYKVKLDTEKLKNFLKALAKESGQEVIDQNFENLDVFLNEFVKYEITLGINDDYTFKKLKGNIALSEQIPNAPHGKATFDLSLSKNHNEGEIAIKFENSEGPAEIGIDFEATTTTPNTVTVSEPEEAEEFDLASIFGGMGLPEETENQKEQP